MTRPGLLIVSFVLVAALIVSQLASDVGWPVVVGFDIVVLGLIGGRAWLRRRSVRGEAPSDSAIRLGGLVGRATVVSATGTGRLREAEHEYDLRLEVQLPRRRPFETRLRAWVPDDQRARVESGRAIPVAADPAEPGHVVLALDMDDPQSIAGLGPFAGGRGGPPESSGGRAISEGRTED